MLLLFMWSQKLPPLLRRQENFRASREIKNKVPLKICEDSELPCPVCPVCPTHSDFWGVFALCLVRTEQFCLRQRLWDQWWVSGFAHPGFNCG